MIRYVAKRVGISLLTIFGMVVIVFFIVRVLPGDAAAVRAGPYASEEQLAQIRDQYGLDKPMAEQFVSYLGNVATGDLGTSIRTDQPVLEELLDRLPASLELAVYAVLMASLLAIPLGVLAAAKRGKFVDGVVRVFAVLGSSMALFWLGLLLIYFFFFRFGWFPGPVDRLAIGTSPPDQVTGFFTIDALLAGKPDLALEAVEYLALPVITLAFVLSAPIVKMVRQSMIHTLNSNYVRTAKAVGVSRREVLFRDAFRNAALPVVTTIGIVFGYMIGGNIIVEFLFSWPGIGRYAYDAIQTNDMEALQGFVIMVGILYVGLNVVVDLVYSWIDPRIRLGGKATA